MMSYGSEWGGSDNINEWDNKLWKSVICVCAKQPPPGQLE